MQSFLDYKDALKEHRGKRTDYFCILLGVKEFKKFFFKKMIYIQLQSFSVLRYLAPGLKVSK